MKDAFSKTGFRARPVRAGSRGVRRALRVTAMMLALPLWPMQAQRVRPPVRTLFGDVAIILRPEIDGTMGIGIAGATRAVTLTVRTSDARRWADSAARLVAPRPAPRRPGRRAAASDTVQRRRVILEEPGVGTGSLDLTRIDSAGTRRYVLFADDAELQGIRQVLEPAEVQTLVTLVRRAAAAPPTRRPRRPPAKRQNVP